jgi:phosphatidate cytidylyltransferase
MLKTRVITAVVLLAVLLPVMFSGSTIALGVVAALFLGGAMWEAMRLFARPHGIAAAIIWTLAFVGLFRAPISALPLYTLCAAAWLLCWVPLLGFGLPALRSGADRLLSLLYMISIFGCLLAMMELFRHSAMYLLSVLALVWVADIGAYFVGRAVGKRKLAPTISPGKSWEGAIGGWLAVISLATLSISIPGLRDTFAVAVFKHWGFVYGVLILSVVVATSVVGDLVESQLKRRAKMKDSSQLLPGHGGVLDRIDALIPVLPLAALIGNLME